jgi:hypothetical protein
MKFRTVLLFTLLLTLALPQIALAAGPSPEVPALPDLVAQFLSLVGIGAFITVAINAGKTIGLVKDGTAPVWSTGLNLLGLVILFGLHVIGYTDFGTIDQGAATLAQLGTLVLALLVQMGAGRWAYGLVKGVPVIGYSYTLKNS